MSLEDNLAFLVDKHDVWNSLDAILTHWVTTVGLVLGKFDIVL